MARKLYPLQGIAQHYAWGGESYIPDLISSSNKQHKPFAELWFGAHHKAPSIIITESGAQALDIWLTKHHSALGADLSTIYKELPFLLKVLDVEHMLSIQIHPSKKEAEEGFHREEEAGIPLNSSERNYKDKNHKPEIMLALTDFWLLHGFKSEERIRQQLLHTPELRCLTQYLYKGGIKCLYEYVMKLEQSEVAQILQPLMDRLMPDYQAGKLAINTPDYWAAQAVDEMMQLDRGIFSIYLFNLVLVPKGKAIFQNSGVPHAYLHGHNVELMANSDNVLRGGLTPKYINTEELLSHIDYLPISPCIIEPARLESGLCFYPTPIPSDFSLYCAELGALEVIQHISVGAQILLVMYGEYTIARDEESLQLMHGESVLIEHGTDCRLECREAGLMVIASVY